jgi:uncharacterized protein (TIGR03437 family)
VLTSVAHGSFEAGPVVPGSLGTVFGQNLAGAVTRLPVDCVEGRILSATSRQGNFQVAAGWAGRVSAQLIVTVDGLQSTPGAAALAAATPGVFVGANLHQDNSVNSAENPAEAGSAIQVDLAGLGEAGATVRVGGRFFSEARYAGRAPGLIGMQQGNPRIPADLPTIGGSLAMCSGTSSGDLRRISRPLEQS